MLSFEHERSKSKGFGRREVNPRPLLEALQPFRHVHLNKSRMNGLHSQPHQLPSPSEKAKEARTISSGV